MWQLWLCLLVAFLLGAALAWLLRGGCKKKISNITDYWSQRFELVEEERDLFAAEAQDSSRLMNENKSLLGRLSSMESGANLASDVLNENKSRLDKTDSKLSKMKSLLEQRDSELSTLEERLNKKNDNTEGRELAGDLNDADAELRIELESKSEELKELTEEYKKSKEKAKTMRAQLNEYEKTNQELLGKESETQKALSAAEKLNLEEAKKSSETQSQLEVTDKKNQALSKDLDNLSEKLALADKKSADDTSKIEEITGLYDQSILDSREFKSKIMQSGNNLRADLSNKKVLCENLEKDIQSIKKEAKENADQAISVQSLLKNKEKENDELVAIEQQLQMALSTAEGLNVEHEEKIIKYRADKKQLTNKLYASKENDLVNENELKVIQGLLVAHEKDSQDLLDNENKLEEELSAQKSIDFESKEIISKYKSKLEKLKSDLQVSQEKGVADTAELKIMQELLVAREKGNQNLAEKEEKLQKALVTAEKTAEKYKKELERNEDADIDHKKELRETLEQDIQSIKEDAKRSADQVASMQNLLKTKEKENDELVTTEQQLQMALSTAKILTTKYEEKIIKYQADKDQLTNKLYVSKEKELVDENELKVMQDLLIAHETGKQNLWDNEKKLEEELSTQKVMDFKNKETISKYESKLEKLKSELQVSQEKGLADIDELKMMQKLLVVYKKGSQDLQEREGQLQKALSSLEAEESKSKEKMLQDNSEIKMLREHLQISNKKEISACDEVGIMKSILDAHVKGNEDLAEKEEKLQKALAIAEKTAEKYKKELEHNEEADLSYKKELCETLEQDIQSIKEKAKRSADQVTSMQSLLKTKEQENDELVATEQQLQMALSTAECLSTEHEEKITKYQAEKEQLTNKLYVSKEKGLVGENDLKIMQGLLITHEKSSQDLLGKKNQLQEELSTLKVKDFESKEIISKYGSKLEKLKSELQASQEKGVADTGELKMMQGLLVAHEKGSQDLQEKESQLQKALSSLEAEESKNKEKVSQDNSEIKMLRERLQASNKKEKSASDEIEMMQSILDVHAKSSQDLDEKEKELQQALTVAEKYKDELERKDKESHQSLFAFNEVSQKLKEQTGQVKSLMHTDKKTAMDVLGKQSLFKTKFGDYKQENKQIKPLQPMSGKASSDTIIKKQQDHSSVIFKSSIKNPQDITPIGNSKIINKSTDHYDIEEIDGIGKGFGKRLRKIGICTTTDLLEKCQNDDSYAKHIAKAMSQNEKTVGIWLDMADLLRVDGVDGKYAELLYLSGIKSSAELATSDMIKIRSKIKNIVKNQHHAKKTPTKKMILNWIALAKRLIG